MQKNYQLEDIQAIAHEVIQQAGHRKCLAFFAPMGAGKTTLINQLCEELHVVDNVSSPTYSIINEYRTAEGAQVVHMDWYRLKDEQDALNAGVEDYLTNSNYCFVEWPERATALLPSDCIKIFIEVVGVAERNIRIEKN